MRWSPHVTVAAVIRRADRFLVVEERPDSQPVINQPAGHLEFGETLLQAVEREVREETGHRFVPLGLIGTYLWPLPGTHRSYLRFCFAGDATAPSATAQLDPDIAATHWLTRDQIAQAAIAPPRSPLVLRCIDDAIQRPLQPLDCLHDVV